MSTAKWHAKRAEEARDQANRGSPYGRKVAERAAAHHALAATVLDALAVPGVASLFDHLAISLTVQTNHGDRTGAKWMLSDEERAALRTLADAAKGTR